MAGPTRKLQCILALSLCILLLLPTLLEIFGYSLLPWESIERLLGGTRGFFKDPDSLGGRLRHRRGLFTHRDGQDLPPVALYNSTREPPEGFEKWIAYARENKCHLGPYTRIEKDLQAFRDGQDGSKLKITQEQISQAAGLPKVSKFVVRDGQMHAETVHWWTDTVLKMAAGFSKDLPDMEFVVNGMDEPRILPGKGRNIDARYHSQQCQNASKDFHEFRHLHGSFSARPEGLEYFPSRDLLPLFSQSKINECHADITFPTHYNLDQLLSEEEQAQLLPWEKREAKLFFRGRSTGGHFNEQTDYTLSHRQRLVELAKEDPNMDIGFVDIIQCNNVCDEMKERYGTVESVDKMTNFRYKYLMSVDGNTFVSRLTRFMSSGSLMFRAGLYSEWYDEWIHHGQHYLQVKLDYSDLKSQLQWAMRHDKEARRIGENAQRFALSRLRNEDMSCYFYRLLLEYAAIVEPSPPQ